MLAKSQGTRGLERSPKTKKSPLCAARSPCAPPPKPKDHDNVCKIPITKTFPGTQRAQMEIRGCESWIHSRPPQTRRPSRLRPHRRRRPLLRLTRVRTPHHPGRLLCARRPHLFANILATQRGAAESFAVCEGIKSLSLFTSAGVRSLFRLAQVVDALMASDADPGNALVAIIERASMALASTLVAEGSCAGAGEQWGAEATGVKTTTGTTRRKKSPPSTPQPPRPASPPRPKVKASGAPKSTSTSRCPPCLLN